MGGGLDHGLRLEMLHIPVHMNWYVGWKISLLYRRSNDN